MPRALALSAFVRAVVRQRARHANAMRAVNDVTGVVLTRRVMSAAAAPGSGGGIAGRDRTWCERGHHADNARDAGARASAEALVRLCAEYRVADAIRELGAAVRGAGPSAFALHGAAERVVAAVGDAVSSAGCLPLASDALVRALLDALRGQRSLMMDLRTAHALLNVSGVASLVRAARLSAPPPPHVDMHSRMPPQASWDRMRSRARVARVVFPGERGGGV